MTSLARSKQLGEQVEEIVLADAEEMEPLEEDDDVVDAIAIEAVSIPVGAEVEIKACSRRISEGSGSRRGRFYLRRRQHEHLLERGAWYLFVVYEGDLEEEDAVDEVVATVPIPAKVIDTIVDSWNVGRGNGGIKQLTWTRLIDLEERGDR